MRPTPVTVGSEEGLSEVITRYEQKGFEGQFSARPGGVIHCHMCSADEPAEQTPLIAMHRFEGSSDPQDEAVLAALECASCGGWGTSVFTYGAGGDAAEGEALKALLDDRDQSPMRRGT